MLGVNNLCGFGAGSGLPPPDFELNFLDPNQDTEAYFDLIAYSAVTHIRSDGYLGFMPANNILQSQTFGTTWVPVNATVSSDAATAPDGTMTADKLLETTATDQHYINQSYTPNSPSLIHRVWSSWAKAAERSWISLRFSAGGIDHYRTFDLANGVLGTTSSGTFDAGMEEHPTQAGWWRCWISVEPTSAVAGNVSLRVCNGDSVANYAGVATNGVLIWGAQVNPGHRLLDYVPTTTSGRLRPALMHRPTTGERVGLMASQGLTQFCRYNRDMTQVARWTATNATVTKNQVGLDGLANKACSVTATANNGTVTQAIVGASSAHMVSVNIKRLTGTGTIGITLNNGTDWKDVTSSVDAESGYVKVFLISNELAVVNFTNPVIGIRLGTSGDSVAVDFWSMKSSGASLFPYPQPSEDHNDQDASGLDGTCYPVISGAAFSSMWNATEGTFLLDFVAGLPYRSDITPPVIFGVYGADESNRLRLESNLNIIGSSNRNLIWGMAKPASPGFASNDATNTFFYGSSYKFVFAYKDNNTTAASSVSPDAYLADGSADTDCIVPTVTEMRFANPKSGGSSTQREITRFRYWRTRHPNALCKEALRS